MSASLRLPAIAAALAASACMHAPEFHAAPVAPSARVGAARPADSTHVFIDSLAGARMLDSARPAQPAAVTVNANALTDLAWMSVINDTVLTRLVRTAVTQNRDVALARARIAEYRAQVGIARAPLKPRVSANVSAATNQAVFGGGPPIQFDAWRATGDVAWELDFWGRTRNGVDAARADLGSQEAAERAAVLSLVSDVALGYLQLLELDEEHDIATRTLTSRRALYTLVVDRYTRGVVSELDVRQFEAQLAAPTARIAQIERQRAQQEHALNVLLGESPMAVQRGGSLIAAAHAVNVPDSLPATLLSRRPDVAQTERAYAAAAARVGVVRASRLPSLTIGGSLGTQAATPDKIFGTNTTVYNLQAGISIPLYSGGRATDELAAARARVDQARAVYERSALTALREAGDALVGARTARDEVVANETLTNALRRALDLSDIRYQNGISSFLEVLDAQRGLFDAELTLAQARLHELQAAVQLFRALGGDWR